LHRSRWSLFNARSRKVGVGNHRTNDKHL